VTVCTYVTEKVPLTGSAKSGGEWLNVTEAAVYFDHPVHTLATHTLNIDLRRPAAGPSARVGIELTAETARALAESILSVLGAVPDAVLSDG
jgi:hypothetical protein